MKLSDVKRWACGPTSGGASCVVASTDGDFVTTLCGRWGELRVRTEQPKRICRRCREKERRRAAQKRLHASTVATKIGTRAKPPRIQSPKLPDLA